MNFIDYFNELSVGSVSLLKSRLFFALLIVIALSRGLWESVVSVGLFGQLRRLMVCAESVRVLLLNFVEHILQ